MAKILIVDDERSIRETLGEFIKDLGHEATLAADAPEALTLTEDIRPDIVVSDIILPGMDGLDLLKRLHEISEDIQVIVITGEPTVETAAVAVRQGAFDYLSKPVSRAGIQATVERALRVKEIIDERRRLAEENLRYREHLEEEVTRKAQALATSEAKYRSVVENANEGIFIAQNGLLQYANPKTSLMTGYSDEELLTMPFVELIHPEDREMVVDRHRRRLAGEVLPDSYAFRFIAADGAARWVEIRPVMIEWEGHPATLNFASDIDERVKRENEEKERRERIRHRDEALVKLATQRALFEADPQHAFSLITEQGAEIIDVDRASVWLFDAMRASISCVDLYDRFTGEHRQGPSYKREQIGAYLAELDHTRLIATSDKASDQRFSEFGYPHEHDAQMGAVLDAAIRLRGEMVGDVCFEMIEGVREWTQEDQDFAGSVATLISVTLESAQRRRAEEALQAALDGTIEAIGRTTETRDPYTAGHQRRVTDLAIEIAKALRLEPERLQGLRAAGLVHDIGKMAIPAEILSKPSALSVNEMSLIKSHPQVAYDILKSTAFPWPVADIVLQHHERIDGSGYPNGLKGDEILLEARILAVADTVEAMASHRPYRAAVGIEAALAEIENQREKQYDPDIVDACIGLFRDKGFSFEYEDRANGHQQPS